MIVAKNILLLLLFSWTSLWASSKDFEKYIEVYQYIAISEMERTGVPASIKLAQGLLESNAGKSTLARKANNHFGIKCGSSWKGKKYQHKDDDYKNGKLIKSCFRKYKSSEDSFYAHSDFLLGNRRYHSLFKLRPTDYKKWAKGLKKAGYATSRTYDKKLIKLVEQYKLFRYDQKASAELTARPPVNQPQTPKEVFSINDAKLVYARAGDTPTSIAKRTKTSLKRILAYNEELKSANQSLEVQEKVFLQSKRRNFRGKKRTHTVQTGETMYDISQNYGVCLEKLYKKNKMSEGTQPAIGENIRIRGKAKKRPRLRTSETISPPPPVLIEDKPIDQIELEEEVEDIIPKQPEKEITPVITKPKPKPKPEKEKEIIVVPEKETNPIITKPKPSQAVYHTVIKGETLWRISQNYGLSVDELMRMNGLKSKIISIGMQLRVK